MVAPASFVSFVPRGTNPPLFGHIDTTDPKQLAQLADDAYFMRVVAHELTMSRAERSITDRVTNALAHGDLSALSPTERAAIVRDIQMIRVGYHGFPEKQADAIVKNITTQSNNQGYTGPGADQVLTTTPRQGGGQLAITAGELYDNEGFAALVDKVFIAAGGKPVGPTFLSGMPGALISGDHMAWRSADMSKWSPQERIEFLQKVAQYGRDGQMDGSEHGALMQDIGRNNRSGGDERSVSLPNGKKVGIDDVMENSTFEKLLLDRFVFGQAPPLRDLIARTDYDNLDFDARVALLNAFTTAQQDHSISEAELSNLSALLKGFAAAPAAPAGSSGTTLSNGTFVSDASVASDDGFATQVQRTLKRSGLLSSSAAPAFSGGAGHNESSIRRLLTLDVSQLSPTRRVQVLEQIAAAASDGVIDSKEVYEIQRQVDALSGRRTFVV